MVSSHDDQSGEQGESGHGDALAPKIIVGGALTIGLIFATVCGGTLWWVNANSDELVEDAEDEVVERATKRAKRAAKRLLRSQKKAGKAKKGKRNKKGKRGKKGKRRNR